MPLGTLDRTPPPFFRQGPSALSKLIFFSALAVFLMVADVRFKWMEPLRATVAVALLPVQRAMAVPLEIWAGGSAYLEGLASAQAQAQAAQRALTAQAERTARTDLLARENTDLRALLELRSAVIARSLAAEVMYTGADPFSRKVYIDRGLNNGVVAGSPVINDKGVLGQVTRVFPLSAEVTLMADRDFAISVLNLRTLQRSVAFGGSRSTGQVGMEIRFMSANADVQEGDALQTSGLDGVYPPGLPVATVRQVERRAEGGFARITLTPAAPSEGLRHVLVLEPLGVQLPPMPVEAGASRPMPEADRQLTTPKREASVP